MAFAQPLVVERKKADNQISHQATALKFSKFILFFFLEDDIRCGEAESRR